jgi:hypothetical protein
MVLFFRKTLLDSLLKVKIMVIDPATTKYMIKATIKADGVIEKSDVVGAIFGQTEGLLGDELDLRELQRSARVGRIEVELESKKMGKVRGRLHYRLLLIRSRQLFLPLLLKVLIVLVRVRQRLLLRKLRMSVSQEEKVLLSVPKSF